MGAAEDVALYGLRTSLGSILENFGFGTVSEDSVDLLSDIMRKFITNVATKSKFYAEHAGRTDAACKDIALAFKKIHFSTSELCDFANQNNFPPPKAFPKFPAVKPNPRPLYHPQPSEKELETRPEYIPEFLQAAHPEWTKEGADYLAVMKPSTSADKKGAAPDFPSFEGCSAKEMGLRKEDRKPPPPVITRTDDSSATGIRSSANIASQRLYNPDYAAQLNKKKNKPLNALREGGSRSTTPIGRTNSPFEPGSEDRNRTDSPSTSKSAEKQKFKPRPPSSASRSLFEPKPNEPSTSAASADGASYEDGAQSPMPRLEQEEQIAGEASLSVPQIDFEESFETPPRIDENLINANILLFQQLKQQQEREAKDKKEKERQKEARQKKKDEQKERKKEAAKLKEEQKKELEAAKKLAKEEEKKRKKEEKARLAAEAKAKAKEAQKLETERRLEEALRAQTSTPIQSAYTPSIVDEGEQKSIKLLITNPMSSNASSTFSPSPIRAPPSLREVTPAPSVIQTNDDEDTIPFYADTSTGGDTTFPLDISMTSAEAATPKKEKKKKHKKDKHRDSSPSSNKKHKKDKEHKKHKKEKKDREEKEKDREHKHKHKEVKEVKEEKPAEPEQKPLTLKIRLGDQTPSNNDYSPYQQQQHEPVRLKFKFSSDKKEEEKVPPLRLGMPSVPKERPTSAEKVKPPKPEKTKSPYDKEKEEKQKRREERKRREREEAEERQKAELERLKREHELKQKREAEEKKRYDDIIREREERERKKEKEREQKLKMEKELALINATTECLFSKKEKEKFKIDKYEKEKEKKKEAPPPPPAPAPPSAPAPSAPGPGPGHDDDDDETLWICPSCHVAWTEGANMVACDICNDWFHWHCVGLLVAPPDDIPWYCKKCSRKPLKRPAKSADSPKKKKKTEGFGYLK